MEISRVFDILDLHKSTYQKDDILCGKVNQPAGKAGKQWKKYSSKDLVDLSNKVSYGLLGLGLARRRKF